MSYGSDGKLAVACPALETKLWSHKSESSKRIVLILELYLTCSASSISRLPKTWCFRLLMQKSEKPCELDWDRSRGGGRSSSSSELKIIKRGDSVSGKNQLRRRY